MATSMRQLVSRVIRVSRRNITGAFVVVPGRPGCCLGPSSCRCFSDAVGDRSTHFGFETVPETEKAKRGELQESCPQCALSSRVDTNGNIERLCNKVLFMTLVPPWMKCLRDCEHWQLFGIHLKHGVIPLCQKTSKHFEGDACCVNCSV